MLNTKKTKIWFYSEFTLEDIGNLLLKNGIISSFDYDYENLYEWIEAESYISNVKFNISRKHSFLKVVEKNQKESFDGEEKEPVSVMLIYSENEPSDNVIEKTAQKIACIFNCSVFTGIINYLGGDEFEYIKTDEIVLNKK